MVTKQDDISLEMESSSKLVHTVATHANINKSQLEEYVHLHSQGKIYCFLTADTVYNQFVKGGWNWK